MPLSIAQHASRVDAVGCSDLGALLGVSPYAGPFDVWAARKLPHLERPGLDADDPQRSEFRRWGDVLEPVIAEEYAARKNVKLRSIAKDKSYRHPDVALVGHPDRMVLKVRRGLECKSAGGRVAHRWGDVEESAVPIEYDLQCRGYMAVTEYDEWDLAVLIGGNDFRVYSLQRDLEVEQTVLDEVRSFDEKYLQAKDVTERPPISDSPHSLDWLGKLYPKNARPLIEPTDELVRIACEFSKWRAAVKSSEAGRDRVKAELCAALQDAEGFIVKGADRKAKPRVKVTWTNNKDGSATDWMRLAMDLAGESGINADLIAKHTTPTSGARVLRVTGTELDNGE